MASVRLGRVNFVDFSADAVTSTKSDYYDSMLYLVPNATGRAAMGR